MERKLVENISKGLQRENARAEVKRAFGRMYVESYEDERIVSDVLSRTMGVKSFSKVNAYQFNYIDDIAKIAVNLYSEEVRGKKFAVRTRRVGTHDFTSRDVSVKVGAALYEFSSGVDLENPEVEIGVEVREKNVYFFTKTIPGPGGLPLGSEGKLVSLVSGGIDSPVATWMMMKRGSPVDIIFVSLAHPIDTVEFLQVIEPLFRRWGHGYDAKIHIIDGKPLVRALTNQELFKYANVTYKRILYLIAQEIARKSSAHGIVTGESIGQVSSQTPENLHTLSNGLEIPVHRPLIGFDKDEIVELARKIGTFPEESHGEFCALFSETPYTSISISDLENDMKHFDFLDELLESDLIIRSSEIASILAELSSKKMEAAEVPDAAVVIDLRKKEKFEKWHYPGAVNVSLQELKSFVEDKGTEKTYVLYCRKGLQSAYGASELRNMGSLAFYTDEGRMKKMLETKNKMA